MAKPAQPRTPRHDGWTRARQQRFLAQLAASGTVAAAARACGISRQSAYRLRARGGAPEFVRAWDAALAANNDVRAEPPAEQLLADQEEVIRRDGRVVEVRRRPCPVGQLLAQLQRLDDGRTAHQRRQRALAANSADASKLSPLRKPAPAGAVPADGDKA